MEYSLRPGAAAGRDIFFGQIPVTFRLLESGRWDRFLKEIVGRQEKSDRLGNGGKPQHVVLLIICGYNMSKMALTGNVLVG